MPNEKQAKIYDIRAVMLERLVTGVEERRLGVKELPEEHKKAIHKAVLEIVNKKKKEEKSDG